MELNGIYPVNPDDRDSCRRFIEFLVPYYRQARQERNTKEFHELAFALWADRFLLIANPEQVDPDWVSWLHGQKKKVHIIPLSPTN